jgi:hypothetical protein
MKILLIILVNLLIYYRFISYEYVSDDIPTYKGKKNKYIEHTFNLIIHILNCLLIYFVFGHNNISFFASLFFAINPVNLQGGLWIGGRHYGISTVLVLAGVLILGIKFWWIPFVLLILSKLDGYIKKYKTPNAINAPMKFIQIRKIIPFIKTYGYYFRLCIFPWRLGFYHTFLFGLNINKEYDKKYYKLNLDFWVGLVLLGSTIYFVQYQFGLLWFFAFIMPWCNFITVTQTITERYVYVANVGMMFFLASVLPYPINLMLVSGYAVRNWFIQPMYSHEYWIKHYNISEMKDNFHLWNNIGYDYAIRGDIGAALDHFFEARKFNPNEYKINLNIANMFIFLKQSDKAEEFIKYAEKGVYEGAQDEQLSYIQKTKNTINMLKETKEFNLKDIVVVK